MAPLRLIRHRLIQSETIQILFVCLDWQNSQFINIVGKDDVSAGFEVTRMELRDMHVLELSPRVYCLIPAHSHSSSNSLQTTLQSRPPTLG
jgi:hypothetical protein